MTVIRGHIGEDMNYPTRLWWPSCGPWLPSIGHHQVVMQQFHMQTFGPKISSDRRKSHGPFIDGKVPCPGGSRGGTLCFALSFRSCPAGCSGCVAGSCGRSGCGVHGVASLGLWHARCSDPVGPSARRQAHQGAGLGGANSRGRWLDRWSDRCSLCSCPGWSHCSSGPCQDPVLRHQPHQVQDCQGQGLHHSLHEAPHWERLLRFFRVLASDLLIKHQLGVWFPPMIGGVSGWDQTLWGEFRVFEKAAEWLTLDSVAHCHFSYMDPIWGTMHG